MPARLSFFEALTDFMSSGPLIAMELEKEGAIAGLRALMGATNSAEARAASAAESPNDMSKWTLRALYGTDNLRNAVHGSDGAQTAARELGLFFPASSARWAHSPHPSQL